MQGDLQIAIRIHPIPIIRTAAIVETVPAPLEAAPLEETAEELLEVGAAAAAAPVPAAAVEAPVVAVTTAALAAAVTAVALVAAAITADPAVNPLWLRVPAQKRVPLND